MPTPVDNQALGLGVKFYRGPTGTTIAPADHADIPDADWLRLPNIFDITPASATRATHDDTDHDSEDGYQSFIGGLRDGGEVQLTLKYRAGDPGQEALEGDFHLELPQLYKLVFPNAHKSARIFYGLVTNIGETTPKDNFIQRTFTIKVSGKAHREDLNAPAEPNP